MDCLRPWLYIGKYQDTLNHQLLFVNQIGAMLQLAELVEHPGIVSLYLPVEDFEPLRFDLLRRGVEFVSAEKRRGQRVLIACGAGVNRSTAFAIAALKEEEGLTLLDAFGVVKRQHLEAMPYLPIWKSLCRYYHEDIPFEKLLTLSEKCRHYPAGH